MLSTSEPHIRVVSDSSGPKGDTDCAAAAHFRLRVAFLALITLSGLGILWSLWLRTTPAGNPDPRLSYNVFYVLFARNEPIGLFLVALFCVAAIFVLHRSRKEEGDLEPRGTLRDPSRCALIALAVFALTAVGTHVVFHDYLLTADENLADFQARIFMRGKLQAEVPPAFWNAVFILKPTFVEYFPDTHSWNTAYLPVYAALRAAFQIMDAQSLLNPVLAALSIVALFATARNLWPNDSFAATTAALILATSSQFLVMSMTSYAMPAHLAFNAIWLWLYSQPNRPRFYLAPFVGVLAIGLHEPIVHALFVLPFLARLLWQRRWPAVFLYAVVYLAGCIAWYCWRAHFQRPGPAGVGSIFRFLNPRMPIIQSMNLLLIISWASLAAPVLAIFGFSRFRGMPPLLHDAMLSCALTFGFYFFFYLDQAHGWGYRYFHSSLACFALIAAAGARSLGEWIGRAAVKRLVYLGAAVSMLVQLPLRAIQAETFVRPFARTAAVLHALPVATVGFDVRRAWYSGDLVRNDPFLEARPIIIAYGLNAEATESLRQLGPGRLIDAELLGRLGLHTSWRNDYTEDPFMLGRGK